MAESYWKAANKRLVNILINGVVRKEKVDPFLAGGGQFLPSYHAFNTSDVAGKVVVSFTAALDLANAAAIEVGVQIAGGLTFISWAI